MTKKPTKPPYRHAYDPIAVDKAIAQAERRGGKVGKRERSLIHRLLKGRHSNPAKHVKKHKNPPTSWLIRIRKGRGPVLYWTGEKFSDDAKPHNFREQSDAVKTATRLIAKHRALGSYQVAVERKKANPSARIEQAAEKFRAFTGHEPKHVDRVPVHSTEKTTYELGPVKSIEYIATRDGERSIYHHPFKAKSRPLLTATTDGKQLHIVGGRYAITDAGIVDR